MIKEKLMEDLKASMFASLNNEQSSYEKEKANIAKNTIQMIRAKILQTEKDKGIELDDNGITDIIVKEVKDRKVAREEFVKGFRQDLIDQTDYEIVVLERYLPKQLTPQEIADIVVGLYNELEDKSVGSIMKAAKAKIGAGSDGKTIAAIVKEII